MLICLSSICLFICLLYVPFIKNEKYNKKSLLFFTSEELGRCKFMVYLFLNTCNEFDSK